MGTNGLIATTNDCACGTTDCTNSTGVYCNISSNSCSTGPLCSNTEGRSANSNACTCGTTGCTTSIGLFCKSNFCAPVAFGSDPIPDCIYKVPEMRSCGIRAAVDAYTEDATISTYGYIVDWNVSGVTDLSHLFENKEKFTSDLSNWKTQNVIKMENMFHECKKFNSDLSKWVTKKVITTKNMFKGCVLFNSDLSKWETQKVTTLDSMFSSAYVFSSNISEWNTSKVESFSGTFKKAKAFNSDITKWDVTKILNMNLMFQDAVAFDKTWCNLNWDGKITPGDFTNSKGMMKCCGAGQFNQPQATSPYIVCTDCSAGQFTSELNADLSCKACPKGWYQDEGKRQFCFPCEPGKKMKRSPTNVFLFDVKKTVTDQLPNTNFNTSSSTRFLDLSQFSSILLALLFP